MDKLLFDFKKFDSFQLEAIEKIEKNENILVTAPTGSGKTVCALYAIKHALKDKNNKKIIYTSPIKALSNQKYNEFHKKFKNIASVGVITGDIKYNLNADILIMTAEILRNLLYKNNKTTINLDIDVQNEVSCIIMDEVHYINDKYRGNVWEETLMLLNPKINLVLLSATLGNAEYFSQWLTKIKNGKPCHVIKKEKRIIPLTHYMYYYYKNFKKLTNKNKKESNYLRKNTNTLIKIKNRGVFNQNNYTKIKNIKKKYYDKNISQSATIKALCSYLKRKNMLPCLFFIFSKKQTVQFATQLDCSFNNIDEQNTARKIIRENIQKLKNRHLYMNTSNYVNLMRLWANGIAYHHAGLQSVYKEIIEILCKHKLIKVIFATETFAVGINAPIKTVVFTNIKKHCDNEYRYLTSTEYFQMGGRAGRRGLDTVGNVILLSNFMSLPDNETVMKKMVSGKSANIYSRFKLNYQLVLKIILEDHLNYDTFISNTLANKQNIDVVKRLKTTEIDPKKYDKYYYLKNEYTHKLTKNHKKFIKKIESHKNFKQDYQLYLTNYDEKQKIINPEINKITDILKQLGYIDANTNNISIKGIIASNINEVDSLMLTEILTNNILNKLNESEICAILASLLSLSYKNEINENTIHYLNVPSTLLKKVNKIIEIRNKLQKIDNIDRDLNFDMIEYAYKWSTGKYIFEQLHYGNFIGIFIKDILRLDNLIQTLENICICIDYDDNVIKKLQNIHSIIIRDIVTTESLYIL